MTVETDAKARARQAAKRWRDANPDKVKAANARWYANNRELSVERVTAWQKANPEKRKQNRRNMIAANPEKQRQQCAAWARANPDKVRANTAAMRHNRRAAPGKLTAAEVSLILQHPCAYCGGPGEHLEHCTPVSRGGWNVVENCVAACARCNRTKGRKTVLEFLGLLPC